MKKDDGSTESKARPKDDLLSKAMRVADNDWQQRKRLRRAQDNKQL